MLGAWSYLYLKKEVHGLGGNLSTFRFGLWVDKKVVCEASFCQSKFRLFVANLSEKFIEDVNLIYIIEGWLNIFVDECQRFEVQRLSILYYLQQRWQLLQDLLLFRRHRPFSIIILKQYINLSPFPPYFLIYFSPSSPSQIFPWPSHNTNCKDEFEVEIEEKMKME